MRKLLRVPHPDSRKGTIVLIVVTAIVVATLSLLAAVYDQGSFFPLFVVPVILWAMRSGTRAGLVAAASASVYSLAFIVLALDRTTTIPYILIAAIVFLTVGYIVGRLSDLRRRLAEQQIELANARAAAEKEVGEKRTLLTEVHHRIKNNMTTVLNLLNLQANATDVPQVASALRDAGNRVRSMVVLYDRLYRSESLEKGPVGAYLETLAHEVIRTMSQGDRIRAVVDSDGLSLEARTLSTLGIIANELVTNAVKYAFPDDRRGTITIGVGRLEDEAIITIADDGVGMPATERLEKPTGFGMMLIAALADQLDGSITVDRTSGTRFTLRFPQSAEAAPSA